MQIASDGPSGAGKSTIAKLLAAKMNCIYLDTGAMYRTVGLLAVRTNTDRHDDAALAELLKNADIRVLRVDGSQHMALGGEDVETLIRTPEISMAASDVASCPSVRRALVALQQKIAAGHAQALRAQLELAFTFLAGNIEHSLFLAQFTADLKQQRRFSDTRCTPDKYRPAGSNIEQYFQQVILCDSNW